MKVTRHLEDPQGRRWLVYERAGSPFSPFAGRRSLVFDGEGIVRRLWHFPSTWNSLSDDELLDLMADPDRRRSNFG
jgi:hypothetical protein